MKLNRVVATGLLASSIALVPTVAMADVQEQAGPKLIVTGTTGPQEVTAFTRPRVTTMGLTISGGTLDTTSYDLDTGEFHVVWTEHSSNHQYESSYKFNQCTNQCKEIGRTRKS